MLSPADLTRRVIFERRALDANGDRLGDWETVVARDAKITALKGSEAVQAARLAGQQPVIIYVRRDQVTRTIDNACRAVDARDLAVIFDITSQIWNPADDSIEILATQHMGGDE